MSPPLLDHLNTTFGFDSFRPGQQEAISTLLGGRNAVVVMPTGAGKSLVFQFVSTLLDGITLVISPLIALMQDQVNGLNRRGVTAAFINSALSVTEQNRRLNELKQGKLRLIYIAPERLRNMGFLEAVKSQKVSLLAVDEAHCISEWGHDFRPDYLHIAQAREMLGNPLTIALTATATPKVQSDISTLLKMGDTATRIVTGFNRSNLNLTVEYTKGFPNKLKFVHQQLTGANHAAGIIYTGTRREAEEVAEFVSTVIRMPVGYYHAGLPAEERTRVQNAFLSCSTNIIVATNAFGMGIDRADVRQVIHFNLPGSLEAYYQEAGRAGRDGKPAQATLIYDPQDRALQEFFINSSFVSSADMKAIYHAIWREPPNRQLKANSTGSETSTSLDEISAHSSLHPVQIRVGISGLERAGVLEHLGDTGTRMYFREGTWDPKKIESAVQDSRIHILHRWSQLERMIHYAEANTCRRAIILQHFGDHGPAEAENCCDNCIQRTAQLTDSTNRETALSLDSSPETSSASPGDFTEMGLRERVPLIILDCVRCSKIKLGKRKIVKILHRSKARDIKLYHYDRNTHYGELEAIKESDLEEFIDQLIQLRYLKTIGGKFPVISLTPAGEIAIKRNTLITLKMRKSLSPETFTRKNAQSKAGGTVEYTKELLNKGLSPELIASERGLALTTIYSHFAILLAKGRINLAQVVHADLQASINTAIEQVGSTDLLTPIRELLPSEINYGMIRCVIAARKSGAHKAALANIEIEDFLNKSHPRHLIGVWQSGWSLGFHSQFSGDQWSRSRVGDLVYRLKYQSDRSVLSELVEIAHELFSQHPELIEVDAILPVPSTSNRAFDPVLAFCDALSERIERPAIAVLRKTRATLPQKEMKTMAQKRNNVAGAFSLNETLKGKRILLVDDLFDSGETLNEITRLLMRSGIKSVCVLTLTSTIHSDA
ncbi:MAG: hypothetical protein A2Z16_10480 [Chloroflexi bacterium RBG_16_54_18]|nr:MAG: hypothetical protein A2Z16_10480 [Chloroflexi bacterium RBG_16_54_18]